MALLNRIRAALDPRVTIEDLEGEDAFTPFKDIGEHLGRGYGIETPRARRRREEVQAQHEVELGMIDGRVGRELLTLLDMDPENEDHSAVVSNMTSRAQNVSTMLASPFAEMRQAGMQELQTLMADIHSAGLAVEERKLRDAEIEAAGLKEDFDAFNTLYDDLYRESADFIERRDSYTALQQSYTGGVEAATNANDIAAINSLQRMIDPGVSVREGDVSLLANWAGVPDILVTAANRVANEGARFTPEQRIELLKLGNDIIAGANTEQTARNARFQTTGGVAQIDERFLNQLGIPTAELRALPGYEGTTNDPGGDREPSEGQNKTESRRAGERANEAVLQGTDSFLEFMGGLWFGDRQSSVRLSEDAQRRLDNLGGPEGLRRAIEAQRQGRRGIIDRSRTQRPTN